MINSKFRLLRRCGSDYLAHLFILIFWQLGKPWLGNIGTSAQSINLATLIAVQFLVSCCSRVISTLLSEGDYPAEHASGAAQKPSEASRCGKNSQNVERERSGERAEL